MCFLASVSTVFLQSDTVLLQSARQSDNQLVIAKHTSRLSQDICVYVLTYMFYSCDLYRYHAYLLRVCLCTQMDLLTSTYFIHPWEIVTLLHT